MLGGYNDLTAFPRGCYHNNLGATRDVALAATGSTSGRMKIAWILVSNLNAAAAANVTITDTSGSIFATIYILSTAAYGEAKVLGGFETSNGLKISASPVNSTAEVSVFYHKDS